MHEACLTQLVGVVRGGVGAENAAHRAPLARALAAALALYPITLYCLTITDTPKTCTMQGRTDTVTPHTLLLKNPLEY